MIERERVLTETERRSEWERRPSIIYRKRYSESAFLTAAAAAAARRIVLEAAQKTIETRVYYMRLSVQYIICSVVFSFRGLLVSFRFFSTFSFCLAKTLCPGARGAPTYPFAKHIASPYLDGNGIIPVGVWQYYNTIY